MTVFHFNIPWIINQSDYNCSSRSLSEWQGRGTVNYVQGVYLTVSGTFFVTGAVFCSSISFGWFGGYLSTCLWVGASFNCIILALNRVVEMIPSANGFCFLFRGKWLFFWMLLSIAYMTTLPFFTRPYPFNSVIATFTMLPVISDDFAQEASHFTTIFIPIHNVTVAVVMLTLYFLLCFNIVRMRRLAKGVNHKSQIQLFSQAFLICTLTTMTAVLYSWMYFFSVSLITTMVSHIFWQTSHGLHGIVYICLNRRIRGEVLKMFHIKKHDYPMTVTLFHA
ncbi:hypothetical protein GCK32_001452 [Trichostrongylus colubriformis]|uniref:7TM GPCR serpentine receptor class x (Srx) domain-containing protein n=1 Tax=Trichostrongylus colubriformis TaxID=6319 RepID=A0AAN8EP53_TRICO